MKPGFYTKRGLHNQDTNRVTNMRKNNSNEREKESKSY